VNAPERSSTNRNLAVALGCLAAGSAALYGATYLPVGPSPFAPPVGLRLTTYPVLFVIYFVAVYVLWRERNRAHSRVLIGLVLGSAVVFRVLVLSGPAPLNNDAWRYLWEGRVLVEGLNPYAAPPGAAVYEGLRAELAQAGDPLFSQLPPRLNRVRSVYGPLATALFTVPHLCPLDRILTLRLMAALCDVGTAFVLAGLLRRLGRAPALALIYAWNPMCLSSFPDRGQIDAPMTLLIALAAYLVVLRRPAWAGVAFGAALLIKLSPLWLVFPFLRLDRARFGAPLGAVLALGALPFAAAGPGSLSGFREFGVYWHNTDSLFGLLAAALEPLHNLLPPNRLARLIVTVAAPAYALWRSLRGDASHPEWLFHTGAAISAAGILLSPVVHPWYTACLLAFLAVTPSPGLLLLTAATMSWFMRFWRPGAGSLGALLVERLGPYEDPWRWPAYLPVYSALIYEWLRSRAALRSRPGDARRGDHSCARES